MMTMTYALLVVGISYLFIATEWINKMTAALLGSFIFVIAGLIGQEDAFSYIDWNVIFLLIGMMIVVAVLKDTGVFQYAAIKTAKAARGKPIRILIMLFIVTALISAFLDNVTTMLMMIPMILLLSQELKLQPMPFIINICIASNIGGTATLIGDPPNILVGSRAKLSFMDFIFNMTPPVLLIMAISIAMIWFFYHKKLKVSNRDRAKLMEYNENSMIVKPLLLRRSLIVVGLLLVGFVLQGALGLEASTIAMCAAMIMLIINDKKKVEQTLMHGVDWETLLFFIGLFMLVGGLHKSGFLELVAHKIVILGNNDPRNISVILLWFSGITSAVLGSVPMVATLIPTVKEIYQVLGVNDGNALWWSLAMGSCLGGLGSPLGLTSNIVTIGIAKRNGIHISFWQFFRYGLIYMSYSFAIATVYVLIRYF
ncbi:MAG: ArsB/NhaD family transporter [Candidatus Cloacimonetes bacterium]|nr:ArsB/NhaD family transporter [Candidatus Cloacimonadota bacterium]